MMNEVRDQVPVGGDPRRTTAPLGIPLEEYRQQLVPGKAVLLDSLRQVKGIKAKYVSVRNSVWARTLMPGYLVVPSVRNSNTRSDVGDLWLTLIDMRGVK